MGSTDTGSAWCLKALHPADPLTEVRGIPDRSAIPSAFVNYQTIAKISPPVGMSAASTWEFNTHLIPHPVTFLAGAADTVSHGPWANAGSVDVLNSQITFDPEEDSSEFVQKCRFWETSISRYRLAYMSVTLYADAPALADQGTVVACQNAITTNKWGTNFTVDPLQPVNTRFPTTKTTFGEMFSTNQVSPPIGTFNYADFPDYESTQAQPNAYFGKIKDGLYMPLKLTRTCQKWRSTADLSLWGGCWMGTNDDVSSQGIGALATETADMNYHPFYKAQMAHITRTEGEVNSGIVGTRVPDFCNDVWGIICGRGLAPTTTLQVYVRAGFEVQVRPSSTLSPYQKLSPPHDSQSLDTYFRVSRELKDAYPSDFNDWSKLLGKISQVLTASAPGASLIPGFGPVLGQVMSGIATLTKQNQRKGKGGRGRGKPGNRRGGGRPQQISGRGSLASTADIARLQATIGNALKKGPKHASFSLVKH